MSMKTCSWGTCSRLLALAALACAGLFTGTAHAAPFPWDTSEVLLGSTNGSRSADDVVADPFNADYIYATQTGSTSQQAIMKFTLTRSGGLITGASNDYIDISTLVHNSAGLKALDIYNADTLYYTLEEGGADTDGLVGRATSIASSPLVHTSVADLTGVRADGGSAYDPEGIAIDRANNFLYVMTDDAADQSVAQYTINGDLSLSATPNWSVTIEAGSSNGRNGIVLSDGRVAAVSGSSSVNIFAVSQDGSTVTNLLGGATSGAGRDTPMDLLEYGGYLYLGWESGIIDAFDLSAPSTTPVASMDLDSVIGSLSLGGLSITSDNHLLVSTRAAGGSTGEIYAFNAVPEPSAFVLAGLALFVVVCLAFRRGQKQG